MEKHYYDFDSITGSCKVECGVWKNEPLDLAGVKVGSASCKQKCPFCKGFDQEENWIKCDRLDEALG
jgi:hypothetical protein